ncbi:MAG: Cohesin domain-containing protein [Chloroflexi bacterium]|jgi:hypothetical protein|nr:MAG: Cohesin domain-containing protein [Chloroflexota bacterium]
MPEPEPEPAPCGFTFANTIDGGDIEAGHGSISVPKAGADFSFAPDSTFTAIGGYFNVDVRVDATGFNIDTAQAHILYDPTLLEAVDQNNDPIEASDLAPLPNGELIADGTWKDVLANAVDPTRGLISYAAGKGSPLNGGSDATTLFTLTTLRFKALTVTTLTSEAVSDATLTFSEHGLRVTKAVFAGNNVTGVLGRATISIADSPCTFSFADMVADAPFVAFGTHAFGNSVSPLSVTWAASAGGSIDANGLFTAGQVAGSFPGAVSATSGSLSSLASVGVSPGPVPAPTTNTITALDSDGDGGQVLIGNHWG